MNVYPGDSLISALFGLTGNKIPGENGVCTFRVTTHKIWRGEAKCGFIEGDQSSVPLELLGSSFHNFGDL